MRYMVIEKFSKGPGPVYERAAAQGRMMPDGLHFIDSWVTDDEQPGTCFQLMETNDAALLEVWMGNWRDLIDFEVFPVISSAETAARLRAQDGSPYPDA
jgi:hypothetical protein